MTTAKKLKNNKEEIIKLWRQKLAKEIPTIKHKEKSAVENNVPELLDALIAEMESPEKKEIIFFSQKHGLERTKFKDYSIGHIITEYNVLKKVIFNWLDEQANTTTARERDLILYAVDQAIEQAAETYYRIKQRVEIDARQIAETKANDLKLEDENRERFIETISHDLNNPLNNIKACIELLEEDDLTIEKINRILNVLKSSTLRAQSLVDDFLKTDKVTDDLPIQKHPVNLLKELKREVEAYKVTKEDNEIIINSDYKDLFVEVDMSMVRRVFHNLMNNALKHGQNGGPITVGLTMESDEVEVSIHNNGYIPEGVIDKVFERYYKINDGDRGWGIGLSFVKEVILAHDGTIKVNSTEKDGTEFIVTLPTGNLDTENAN